MWLDISSSEAEWETTYQWLVTPGLDESLQRVRGEVCVNLGQNHGSSRRKLELQVLANLLMWMPRFELWSSYSAVSASIYKLSLHPTLRCFKGESGLHNKNRVVRTVWLIFWDRDSQETLPCVNMGIGILTSLVFVSPWSREHGPQRLLCSSILEKWNSGSPVHPVLLKEWTINKT